MSGLILGVINIAIVVVVLLLVGAIIMWALGYIHVAVPDMVQRLYVAVVVLIALYMVVALLFGLPSIVNVFSFR